MINKIKGLFNMLYVYFCGGGDTVDSVVKEFTKATNRLSAIMEGEKTKADQLLEEMNRLGELRLAAVDEAIRASNIKANINKLLGV